MTKQELFGLLLLIIVLIFAGCVIYFGTQLIIESKWFDKLMDRLIKFILWLSTPLQILTKRIIEWVEKVSDDNHTLQMAKASIRDKKRGGIDYCPLCQSFSLKECQNIIDYQDELSEAFAGRILEAIDSGSANFASSKFNKIVEMALRGKNG